MTLNNKKSYQGVLSMPFTYLCDGITPSVRSSLSLRGTGTPSQLLQGTTSSLRRERPAELKQRSPDYVCSWCVYVVVSCSYLGDPALCFRARVRWGSSRITKNIVWITVILQLTSKESKCRVDIPAQRAKGMTYQHRRQRCGVKQVRTRATSEIRGDHGT